MTPLHPDTRVMMEHDEKNMSTRVVDMIAPIGFGQRGLLVSPPRAGKTMLMQNMARAVLKNFPEAYVIMLLIDERPEEVTDMEREVKGERCEVISSTLMSRRLDTSKSLRWFWKKQNGLLKAESTLSYFLIRSRDLGELGIPNVLSLVRLCLVDWTQMRCKSQKHSSVLLERSKKAVR